MFFGSNKKQSQVSRTKTNKRSVNKRNPRKKIVFSFPWKKAMFMGFIVLPIFLFVGMSQWIQNPENMKIDLVRVSGELRILDKGKLHAIIEPYTKTNLYLLDAEGLEKALEDNPWVQSASMTRILPDTLRVNVVEQNPVALWGKDAMLADDGQIIHAVWDEQKEELPTLYSPTVKGRNMAQGFLKIRQWMKGFPIRMTEFTENARGSWKIKLENGLVLKIGRDHQQKRLKRFMVAYKQSLMGSIDEIKVIDLRYTNGFAVQWKKGYSSQG